MTPIAYLRLAALTFLIQLSISLPAQDSILTFYRDANGKVTQQSKETAKELQRVARLDGQVKLWLTLDYEFNFYFDQMTEEEIAAQKAEVKRQMDAILDPLIGGGDVQHLEREPVFSGPSCGVWATQQGLNSLLRDTRILQISGARSSPSTSQ